MKIIFLRAYDFPIGGAPQNRLLGICRGLIEQGHKIEVHQFAPSKLEIPQNLLPNQVYENVTIFNHAWRWSPAGNKFHQLNGIFWGFTLTILALFRSNQQSRVDYIFINVEKLAYLAPIFLISRIIGAKLGRDLNEYPSYILNPEAYTRFSIRFKKFTNYKLFDSLFFMTSYLKDYYIELCKRNVKTLILPMTVDVDRFPVQSDNFINSNIITYCGDLSQNKDGVITLIESFAILIADFPNLILKLIGTNKDKQYIESLIEMTKQMGISKNVLFVGYVNPDMIPTELYKSRLLVLSRPSSIQAQGGFPTKLGEYLATGIPVVVTKVGEIPLYLTDEVNAFMAEPDDASSFANAMKRSLINNELSLKVGINGRKTALTFFSHREQGRLTSAFLLSNK